MGSRQSRLLQRFVREVYTSQNCLKECVMAPNLNEIKSDAMKLSIEERADLADRLWASVEPPAAVDAAWAAEIECRVRQIETSEVDTISHEKVIAELRNKFG